MTEDTLKLLKALKEVGYELVTVFVADKRVPQSVELEKSNRNNGVGTYWKDNTTFTVEGGPVRIVCALPEVDGTCFGLSGSGWPKIWDVIKRVNSSGGGLGHSHSLPEGLVKFYDAGFYDLAEID